MSKGQHTFRQGDVTKALKGARNAGVNVKGFEINRDGKIVVFTDNPESPTSAHIRNEWDDVR